MRNLTLKEMNEVQGGVAPAVVLAVGLALAVFSSPAGEGSDNVGGGFGDQCTPDNPSGNTNQSTGG